MIWKNWQQDTASIGLGLVLGWAITIHKSQGLTLGKVVMDVGVRETTVGSTFVGCSRVRSPRNLAFRNSFPFQRVQRLNNARRMRIVAEEMQRLAALQ